MLLLFTLFFFQSPCTLSLAPALRCPRNRAGPASAGVGAKSSPSAFPGPAGPAGT